VGFVFAESPRKVSLAQAMRLTELVPPPVARIGVFVDAGEDEIIETVHDAGLTAVQLCGDETPEFCARLGVAVVKALQVGVDFAYENAEPFRGRATAFLLDTYDSQRRGGTSRTFTWQEVGQAPGWAPVFVAGGLTADNVGDAIRAMRPFAVDVSSGVESAPGIKDSDKIARFCAAVRAADEEVYAR
jgi:phosphoribosylanthranilate isomerase